MLYTDPTIVPDSSKYHRLYFTEGSPYDALLEVLHVVCSVATYYGTGESKLSASATQVQIPTKIEVCPEDV